MGSGVEVNRSEDRNRNKNGELLVLWYVLHFPFPLHISQSRINLVVEKNGNTEPERGVLIIVRTDLPF